MAPPTDQKKEDNLASSVDDATFHPPPTSSKASRPKRARTKTEKKGDAPQISSRFHCNYCARDLSLQIRARCAVCADYDSCLDCFSVGASLKPHEPAHAYRLVEVVHTPVYQHGWSADEEDKLLEGLETYGVGNWDQVANSIGSKTAEETEQHFLKVYLQSSQAPLPDPSRLLSAAKPVTDDEEMDSKSLRVMHKHQIEDAAGWMPKRQDFVYEWDNEAEEILGDMEITDEDSPEDRELKLRVLEIYNSKLDERKRRKDFVVERGLTDFKNYLAEEKKRSKEEKEVREKLRPFARFVSVSDFERIVDGMMEEIKLRKQIETYKEGRLLGATTTAEANRIAKSRDKTANHKPKVNGDYPPTPESKNVSDGEFRALLIGREPDVSMQAGAELLSRAELSLCTTLKITVHQYLIMKEVLVRENARTGQLKRKDAKNIIRLDPAKVLKVYDYLAACGWIRVPSSQRE